MKVNPLVSAVIPAYNAAATIVRAVESVRKQDYHPIEIIVVDDASTDDTRTVLSGLLSSDMKVIAYDSNRGVANARNEGLSHASGKYVAFLDADDVWRPGKITRQVQLMEDHPGLTLVTCDNIVIGPTGMVKKRAHQDRPPASGPEAWRVLLNYNFVATSTVLARRADLRELGGFDPELKVAEDLDLWIRLALNGEVAVVPEVLVEYHEYPTSLSRSEVNWEMDVVLPMIERYLSRLESRMTDRDRNELRGRRYFDIGSNLYSRGSYFQCLPLFWRAAQCGMRPVKSLSYFPRVLVAAALRSLRGAIRLFVQQ